MIDSMQKRELLAEYFDEYAILLTEKQRQYFTDYYFEDMSITEISESKAVSRTAIFDLLKRTEDILVNYENKLQLISNKRARKIAIDQILEITTDQRIIKLLQEIE